MEDPREEARNIARYSLAMLTQKESSVEAAVRAMLRIANLLDHAWWTVWAQLQLTELVDEDTAKDVVRPLLEVAFPDLKRQEQILDSALSDMLGTRRTQLTRLVTTLRTSATSSTTFRPMRRAFCAPSRLSVSSNGIPVTGF